MDSQPSDLLSLVIFFSLIFAVSGVLTFIAWFKRHAEENYESAFTAERIEKIKHYVVTKDGPDAFPLSVEVLAVTKSNEEIAACVSYIAQSDFDDKVYVAYSLLRVPKS